MLWDPFLSMMWTQSQYPQMYVLMLVYDYGRGWLELSRHMLVTLLVFWGCPWIHCYSFWANLYLHIDSGTPRWLSFARLERVEATHTMLFFLMKPIQAHIVYNSIFQLHGARWPTSTSLSAGMRAPHPRWGCGVLAPWSSMEFEMVLSARYSCESPNHSKHEKNKNINKTVMSANWVGAMLAEKCNYLFFMCFRSICKNRGERNDIITWHALWKGYS